MAPAATDAARTTAGNGSAASSARPAPPYDGIAWASSCRTRRESMGARGRNPPDGGGEAPSTLGGETRSTGGSVDRLARRQRLDQLGVDVGDMAVLRSL